MARGPSAPRSSEMVAALLCRMMALAPSDGQPAGGGCSSRKVVQNGVHGAEEWRSRRIITLEFKAEIVERCRFHDGTSATWSGTSI